MLPSIIYNIALDAALRAANIPIDGVSVDTVNGVRAIVVQYQASATDPQKVQGQSIVDNFVLQVRTKRAFAAVAADVQALSAADKTKLQLGVATQFIIDHPQFAISLGINIPGDS